MNNMNRKHLLFILLGGVAAMVAITGWGIGWLADRFVTDRSGAIAAAVCVSIALGLVWVLAYSEGRDGMWGPLCGVFYGTLGLYAAVLGFNFHSDFKGYVFIALLAVGISCYKCRDEWLPIPE